MTALHTLVVAEDPDYPGDRDAYLFSVECPGVTDGCRAYVECQPCNSDSEISEALWDEPVRHGAEHVQIEDLGWSLATDQCFLLDNPDTRDLARPPLGAFPGRYAVVIKYDRYGDVEISPADAAGGAS
jgi:hypothetical protein